MPPPCRRKYGPLRFVSTWILESTYKYVRSAFGPGTRNTSQQVINNLNAREVKSHRCLHKRTKIRLCEKTSSAIDDSLVHTKDGRFFRLIKKDSTDDTRWKAAPIETDLWSTDGVGLPFLDWKTLGVEKYVREGNETTYVIEADIDAKAILCKSCISTLPIDWLTYQIH